MAGKQKFYVVWKGRETGIFRTWEECRVQVIGHAGAKYRAFDSHREAEQAYRGSYEEHMRPRTSEKARAPARRGAGGAHKPLAGSVAVDAACSGNPGTLEYRCVDLATGAEIFREGPFDDGTNNIGEFLAIVDALRFLERNNLPLPVYSDSRTAIGWVRNGRCGTKHRQTEENAELFRRIGHAEAWLRSGDRANRVLKWDTGAWGEIPADFGRK